MEAMELKRGPSVVKALRPAQRLWHRSTLSLGIPTFGLTLKMDGVSCLMVALSCSGGILGELNESQLWAGDAKHLNIAILKCCISKHRSVIN